VKAAHRSSHVFISHAGEDSPFADLVAVKLQEEEAIRPWIDTDHITTGLDILDALRDGLSSMDIFIALISQPSLASGWVKQEVQYALRKYIEGESLLVMPFIIDNTKLSELDELHPFLLNMRVDSITANAAGADSVVRAVIRASGLSGRSHSNEQESGFRRDHEIEDLIKDVKLGNWDTAIDPAFKVLAATGDDGSNAIFRRLVVYQACPDPGLAWGARMTMETLVDLAPHLFGRSLIASMASNSDFSVRGSAASICLVLAQFAPDRVPVDILMKLARHDEDWYVMEPATAALKSLCRARRNILSFFYRGLRQPDSQARAHAARALRGIAAREPEILEAERLKRALDYLHGVGDKETELYVAEAYERAGVTQFEDGYKYGLGQ
jgi:TIR domain